MIKRSIKKRIIIATISLAILSITYMFPTVYSSNNINQILSYTEPNKISIYLIDNSNLVTRVNTIIDSDNDSIEKKAKKIVDALTIDSDYSKYNPQEFKSIIPKGTKLISLDFNNNILKINFNNDFLNVTKENEEKMIEALIYSLTEIDEIKGIMIFVNNEHLYKLPKSKKILPDILDRNYGINKVYELDNFKNISKTTIYYLNKCEIKKCYTPVTYISNDSKDKIEVIIEKLKSNPINQTNLMSYLASNAELLDYEIVENTISLSFNNNILNSFDSKDILEEVKYSIALSIRDTYGINEVIFNIPDTENTKISI